MESGCSRTEAGPRGSSHGKHEREVGQRHWPGPGRDSATVASRSERMAQGVGAEPGRPRQPGAGNPPGVCADGRPRGRRSAGAGDGGLHLRRCRPKKVAPTDPKRKMRGGEPRPLRVRLLGGLLIYVMTIYCSPARRTGHRRGREGSGLYPELGVLGIHEGKSPALVREVGRLTALLPSYEIVQQELAERGLKLNIKEVHGIGQYAGQAALTYRRRELELYREGQLPAADGRGKRFGAMIDGGRTKIRTLKRRQKGSGKTKTQKRRFRTDWREPKQIIVFEMDEHGRMKKGTKPILDGTFQGPDEILEVLAMRLHQVGASQAKVVAFRADGALWIWERLEWVRQRVGLKEQQVSRGLDWCHAVHHISLALEPLVDGAERQR